MVGGGGGGGGRIERDGVGSALAGSWRCASLTRLRGMGRRCFDVLEQAWLELPSFL